MANVAPGELAALLGVRRQRRSQEFTSLDLSQAVVRGLPVESVDRLAALIAPGDTALRHRLVPKATLARRQQTAERRLSAEEGDRVARLARLWSFARDIWGSAPAAQRFFAEAHPLLRGRVPIEVATESEIGTRAVEDLLGRLKYGSAA